VVSHSSAAPMSPNHSVLVPQAVVGVMRQRMLPATVSKQDALTVPKLHGGSFQSFGDALDSALWHPSTSGLEAEVAQGDESGTSATRMPLGGRVQFPFSEITTSEGPQQRSSLVGVPADAQRTETPVHEDQDPNALTGQHGADDKVVSSGAGKTPELKPRQKIQADVSIRTPPGPLRQTATDTGGNVAAGSYGEAKVPEPGVSNTFSVRQTQAGRSASVRPPQPADQTENANSQPNTHSFRAETEAFRIDLHADTELTREIESSKARPPGMKDGTEPVALGARFERSAQEQTQNSTVDVESGKVFAGKASVHGQAPATRADEMTKAATTTQGTQTARRQVAPNASEEDKRSEKASLDSRPEINMPKNAIAQPATAFRTPGGIANENTKTQGGTRPGELVEVAQSSVAGPAKEMVVRFQGNAGEVVSVRLLDQRGQVQVAVRSSDPFTAAQLRQDLSSLTSSLDRIGWKADTAASPTAQAPGLHNPSRSDNESQTGHKGSTPAWEESPEKKKYSTSELWDKVLAGQNR
jgi:hypothetical protein